MDKKLEKKTQKSSKVNSFVANNCFIFGKFRFNFNYLDFFKSLIKNLLKKWVQETNLKFK